MKMLLKLLLFIQLLSLSLFAFNQDLLLSKNKLMIDEITNPQELDWIYKNTYFDSVKLEVLKNKNLSYVTYEYAKRTDSKNETIQPKIQKTSYAIKEYKIAQAKYRRREQERKNQQLIKKLKSSSGNPDFYSNYLKSTNKTLRILAENNLQKDICQTANKALSSKLVKKYKTTKYKTFLLCRNDLEAKLRSHILSTAKNRDILKFLLNSSNYPIHQKKLLNIIRRLNHKNTLVYLNNKISKNLTDDSLIKVLKSLNKETYIFDYVKNDIHPLHTAVLKWLLNKKSNKIDNYLLLKKDLYKYNTKSSELLFLLIYNKFEKINKIKQNSKIYAQLISSLKNISSTRRIQIFKEIFSKQENKYVFLKYKILTEFNSSKYQNEFRKILSEVNFSFENDFLKSKIINKKLQGKHSDILKAYTQIFYGKNCNKRTSFSNEESSEIINLATFYLNNLKNNHSYLLNKAIKCLDNREQLMELLKSLKKEQLPSSEEIKKFASYYENSLSVDNKLWLNAQYGKKVAKFTLLDKTIIFFQTPLGMGIIIVIAIIIILFILRARKISSYRSKKEKLLSDMQEFLDSFQQEISDFTAFKNFTEFKKIDKNILQIYNRTSEDIKQLDKINIYNSKTYKLINNMTLSFGENKEQVIDISKNIDAILSTYKTTLSEFSKINASINDFKSTLNNYKQELEPYLSFKEMKDTDNSITNLLNQLQNIYEGLNEDSISLEELSSLTQSSSQELQKIENTLKEVKRTYKENYKSIQSLQDKEQTIKLDQREILDSIRSACTTYSDNKEMEEIDELISNLESQESNLKTLLVKIDKSSIANFKNNISKTENEFSNINKSVQNILDKLKIESKKTVDHLLIFKELVKLQSNVKQLEKDIKNVGKNDESIELLKKLSNLKEDVNSTAENIKSKNRKKLTEIEDLFEKMNDTYKNLRDEFKNKFNGYFKFKGFDFKKKKEWVLKNGFFSWLFDDEKIKEVFEFLDDKNNLDVLLDDEKVNKYLKLFPSKSVQDDIFYSKIIEGIDKSTLIEVLSKTYNPKKVTAVKKKLKEDPSKQKVIDDFTAISNKIKRI